MIIFVALGSFGLRPFDSVEFLLLDSLKLVLSHTSLAEGNLCSWSMAPSTAASGVFGSRYYLVQLNWRPLDASIEMMGLWSFRKPPA